MLQQILVMTVAIPLVMGIAIALAGRGQDGARAALTGILFLAAALVIHLLNEGLPAFPPVASKHKIMFVLVGYAVLIAAYAATRRTLSTVSAWILSILAFTIPIYWIGQNIFKANVTKTLTVVAVLVIAVLIVPAASRAQQALSRARPSAFGPALLAVFIATALTSVFGAYIGMSTIAGSLAALTGGWLLVSYVRFLRGDDTAFSLAPISALALGWTALLHLVMVALFAPSAQIASVVLSILPLGVALFADRSPTLLTALPRATQPVALGVLCAIPAIAAILIAALTPA